MPIPVLIFKGGKKKPLALELWNPTENLDKTSEWIVVGGWGSFTFMIIKISITIKN
jgi:hypothetical protein